jgi:roadblock/LC7 domain-containing protein
MTDRIAEITARCEAATPGEWVYDWGKDSISTASGTMVVGIHGRAYGNDTLEINESDAEFISHAREDIPFLLAEIARLNEAIAVLDKAADKANEDYLNLLDENRWIPVSNPPEAFGDYAVVIDGEVKIAFYSKETNTWVIEHYFVGPTHWRPLPKPPEGDKNDG